VQCSNVLSRFGIDMASLAEPVEKNIQDFLRVKLSRWT
jgi:hypothetical protein